MDMQLLQLFFFSFSSCVRGEGSNTDIEEEEEEEEDKKYCLDARASIGGGYLVVCACVC